MAFAVFAGVSVGLLFLGRRLLASAFDDPVCKAFSYFALFCCLPVYMMLWNGQMHVFIVLAMTLVLAGLMRLEQEPQRADRYLRWIQLGLLISLLSKPVVALMLPVLFILPETRRKLLLARCRLRGRVAPVLVGPAAEPRRLQRHALAIHPQCVVPCQTGHKCGASKRGGFLE